MDQRIDPESNYVSEMFLRGINAFLQFACNQADYEERQTHGEKFYTVGESSGADQSTGEEEMWENPTWNAHEDHYQGSDTFWRNMVILEPFEVQNCRYALDVSLSEVMPVLLKSGQSAAREEVVEEMKDTRSMKQHWCRSKVMSEYGLSIFYDRLKPRSNHKLPE
ncbi:hypothetical protein F2Q70_00035845 [Brassica cretica]|uniref:Uncharacterized protein n=1 Tax=Brassica cretica TaxID=69181 RepID=A0A8S9JST7_BRACR|nr:hypothetical protein F2Q70_00035845 [Brassica cretica]